ncbi:lysophospholipid acyltransferase family protein [Algibacter luteus]|uniref:lysophospholipid acyltransferase family protein n=1 Tax=Algibacter luteus TaxID=1178825 RepID=UPI002597DF3B|nr:lysophospholipid acyltransferase family protein [Algibacter luteus]WJJ95956.1 lysophospholipid acyltransferase family protein [Algibacter luteus]
MKFLWLTFVRAYLSVGMFFYFRRIKIYDVKHVPKNKPVLLLSNHQNALLDALIIATISGRFSYFLTRAAVFKKPLIAKILKSLQMLPVYRIRDGWGNISNNNAIFEACSELLTENACVVIFPEGNHNLNRTVRPLSKGFTRIVFAALEKHPNLDLQLLPVGVNYRHAHKFPDSTSVYFGKPIAATQFISDNRNNDVVELKARIHAEITQLTTHIPSESYQETLKRLEDLNFDFLDPKAVNACIKSNFENYNIQKFKKKNILSRILKFLFIIVFIVPYVIWKFAVKPKVKEIEFVSTFRFAVAITLAPLWLASLFVAMLLCFNIVTACFVIIVCLVVAIAAVKS